MNRNPLLMPVELPRNWAGEASQGESAENTSVARRSWGPFAVPVAASLVSTAAGTLYGFFRLGDAEPAGPRLVGETVLVAALCAMALTMAIGVALALARRRGPGK
jgi:hypothetical protein